jgi:hypothetical protein
MLKHLLSRFIARMAMNVADACVTDHAVCPDGKNKTHGHKAGFMIPNAHARGGLPRENLGFALQTQTVDVADDNADRDHSARFGGSSSDE